MAYDLLPRFTMSTPKARFSLCAALVMLGVALVFPAIAIADPIDPIASGWTLVRHADNNGGWHPVDDNLAGTAVYGTVGTETSAGDFSVDFNASVNGWDQILFIFGDRSKWMIMDRSQLSISVANQPLQILASYLNPNPYTALMYNRPGFAEDPWFSATDHSSAIFSGDILYGENGFGGPHFSNGPGAHLGANVFIRNSTAASVPDGSSTGMLLLLALVVGDAGRRAACILPRRGRRL